MHPVKVVYLIENWVFEIMVRVMNSTVWCVPVCAEPVHVIGELLLILKPSWESRKRKLIEVFYLVLLGFLLADH